MTSTILILATVAVLIAIGFHASDLDVYNGKQQHRPGQR